MIGVPEPTGGIVRKDSFVDDSVWLWTSPVTRAKAGSSSSTSMSASVQGLNSGSGCSPGGKELCPVQALPSTLWSRSKGSIPA